MIKTGRGRREYCLSAVLRVFKDLSQDNNVLVSYDKLQERLIATGKLEFGGSMMIEDD